MVFWNEGTNRVQTYCGLEIAIMTMKPSSSWSQRVPAPAAAPAKSRSIVPYVRAQWSGAPSPVPWGASRQAEFQHRHSQK